MCNYFVQVFCFVFFPLKARLRFGEKGQFDVYNCIFWNSSLGTASGRGLNCQLPRWTAGRVCCLATGFKRLWGRAEYWFCSHEMKNAFQAGIRHLKIPSDIIEKIPQKSSVGSYFLWLMFLQLPFMTCPVWPCGYKMSQHPKDMQKNTLNGLFSFST